MAEPRPTASSRFFQDIGLSYEQPTPLSAHKPLDPKAGRSGLDRADSVPAGPSPRTVQREAARDRLRLRQEKHAAAAAAAAAAADTAPWEGHAVSPTHYGDGSGARDHEEREDEDEDDDEEDYDPTAAAVEQAMREAEALMQAAGKWGNARLGDRMAGRTAGGDKNRRSPQQQLSPGNHSSFVAAAEPLASAAATQSSDRLWLKPTAAPDRAASRAALMATLSKSPAGRDPPAGRRAELDAMKPSSLRRAAVSAGVDGGTLDALEDSDAPRESLITLLLQMEPPPQAGQEADYVRAPDYLSAESVVSSTSSMVLARPTVRTANAPRDLPSWWHPERKFCAEASAAACVVTSGQQRNIRLLPVGHPGYSRPPGWPPLWQGLAGALCDPTPGGREAGAGAGLPFLDP